MGVGDDTGTASTSAAGYGTTTVTIPGGFWLASFGALFVGSSSRSARGRAALLGVVYAVLRGVVLGAISAMSTPTKASSRAAVVSTAGVFLASLFLFTTRIVGRRRSGVRGDRGPRRALLLYFFVSILSIFDWGFLYTEEFRSVGVVVTMFAMVLAAFCLALDFGIIEAGEKSRSAKGVEWYSAYGLTVTLIWLYISILRLLALLARNRARPFPEWAWWTWP